MEETYVAEYKDRLKKAGLRDFVPGHLQARMCCDHAVQTYPATFFRSLVADLVFGRNNLRDNNPALLGLHTGRRQSRLDFQRFPWSDLNRRYKLPEGEETPAVAFHGVVHGAFPGGYDPDTLVIAVAESLFPSAEIQPDYKQLSYKLGIANVIGRGVAMASAGRCQLPLGKRAAPAVYVDDLALDGLFTTGYARETSMPRANFLNKYSEIQHPSIPEEEERLI
jgi:hypothetical protein